MRVVVGRIGRAHGIRGEVGVEVRTDEPEERFAVGATLLAAGRPLRVAATRWHSGRLLVAFDGVADRGAAESLRGALLEADVDPAAAPTEPDTYYDRQLVGLAVVGPDGRRYGAVREVVHLPGHDLLDVVPGTGTGEGPGVLVPFVAAIVPTVDLDAGLLVVTPPPGLFDDSAASPDAASPDDASPDDAAAVPPAPADHDPSAP